MRAVLIRYSPARCGVDDGYRGAHTEHMTVKVLGPLDTGTEPLSPRERAILTALIVRLGSAMSPSELAEAYWGDEPPTTWAQQVKTSVARIRTRLGKGTVETRGSEYALALEPDVIDAVRFERLVSAARGHVLHGEYDRATDVYRRAIGLWRGAPFPDVSDWEPAAVEAMRLDAIRRSAEEELLDARLKAGEHRAVIPEAERLVRESPLAEDRWALLALANYQSGRQADALAVLRAARERLMDELGIEPGARLSQLETAILRQDPALAPAVLLTRVSADCPYRGLTAFGTADADVFFGRETEIDEILSRLGHGTITVIAGPSGSGKSSVMLAGVVPRLDERGWSTELVRPGTASAMRMRVLAEDRTVDVAAIDQAEELLRAADDEVGAFCAAAAEFVAQGGCIVLTIRSDFLDEAAALPAVGAAIARGVHLLGPLSPEALRAAIVEPARRAGLRLEPGLVELVMRDAAGRSSTLPPLSHALQETWVRREGVTLTVGGYEAAGGISGAIAQSAESLYQRLDEHGRELCRSTMLRLIERVDDGVAVRRRVPAAPLMADPARRAILDELVATRLVSIDGDSLEIAHEAVATAWPRLDAWLEEDAEGARLLRHVESAAAQWDHDGRPDDDLTRGARLEAILEWQSDADPDLTTIEQDFLTAAAQRRDGEIHAVALQAARDRHQNRRLRWALAGAAALLVASVVSTAVAVGRGGEAADAAQETLIQAVTSTSTSLLGTNREMAALLAVEAHRLWPDDARSADALMSAMASANPLVGNAYIPGARWRIGAWPIAGTDEIAVVKEYRELGIYDGRTGELVRELAVLPDTDHLFRPWVRVSGDGTTIAVVQHAAEPSGGGPGADDPDGTRDEIVRFFDVATGAQVGEAVRADDLAVSVDLSPDGSLLTWATMGRLVVLERDTGRVRTSDSVRPVDSPPDEVLAASAFDADGRIVVTNRDDAGMVLDPESLAVVDRFRVGDDTGGEALAVSGDGLVTSLGWDGMSTTRIGEGMLWRTDLAFGDCSRLAVSGPQRLVVCGDENGALRRWDLDTGDRIGDRWQYQLGGAGDLAVSEDGSEVLLLSAITPSVARVRLDGSGPASTTIGDPGLTVSWGFDPDSRFVVLGLAETLTTDSPQYEVWDAVENELVLRIPDDLDVEDDSIVADPRWVGAHELLVWLPDLETDLLRTAVVDVRTGAITPTELPTNTWWVFTDPEAEVVYVALNDIPETEPVESTELLAYDAQTWDRLPFTVDVEGEITHVSTNADHSRIAVTESLPAEPAYRTTVYDETGRAIASGLPDSQATVMMPDGSLVAATSLHLDVYSDTLEHIGTLPGVGNWVWSLSASRTGLLLAHGASGAGLALIDVAENRRIGGTIAAAQVETSAIRPDGLGFITSGEIGVQYWTLDPDEHARAACELVGREPTPEEWQTYFSALGEQHPLCS